jgi:hypothetical protein
VIQYQMTQTHDGRRALTFVGSDGSFHAINSDTLGFDATLAAIMANDLDSAIIHSTPLTTIVARLREVSDEFGTDGDVVTRNGKALPSRLGSLLLSYARSGDRALNALCRFIMRLDANPSKRSVESLYDWVEANGLTINTDGFIVAYKGVGNDGLSVHSGTAAVDGVVINGRIPNRVGSVVTMPRNEVQDDPSIGCHQGLHVGSHSYASSFGARLLTCVVDPADVVSVPTDCGAAKMRVCRYTVVSINEAKASYPHTVVEDYDDFADDDHDCDCPYCGR